MDYASIKHLHMAAVALSALGFAARSVAALQGAAWVHSRAAKTLPHIVDTVLLGSALTLAWMLRLQPLENAWLMAKILGLLAYIGLGMVALRPRFSRPVRSAATAAAWLVLAWIVSVAMLKNPWGFFHAMA
jgi:uncharacterized membrane protein SirB2